MSHKKRLIKTLREKAEFHLTVENHQVQSIRRDFDSPQNALALIPGWSLIKKNIVSGHGEARPGPHISKHASRCLILINLKYRSR